MAKAACLQCRFCGEPLRITFADLGTQPLCEHYLQLEQLNKMEPFYPLHVYVCEKCFLVQLEASIPSEDIFREYSYFSSHSKGWLKHAEDYTEMITKRLNLSKNSQVVEIGSNDGYLLQYFAQRGIPILGIEPAANIAAEAIGKGIPTVVKFFGLESSRELVNQNKQADLLIGNNVLAQIPDLTCFVEGLKTLLKPSGVITLEFHHLMKLMENNQFDTISHERFSYFSFIVVEKLLASHGLTIFDVEELPTHGGSLRVYACHAENKSIPVTNRPEQLRDKEKAYQLTEIETYLSFAERVKVTKLDILDCVVKIKRNKKSVAGYGAHAEAHTLLNYCGIRSDLLDYIVDRNPSKQGKFLAGTHIPIFHPDKIKETKPAYILVLAWNIKKEIMTQMSYIGDWGGQFIVPIPKIMRYDADGTQISKTFSVQEGSE